MQSSEFPQVTFAKIFVENMDRLKELAARVSYKDWKADVRDDRGRPYLQVLFEGNCSVTGEKKPQSSRKWFLSFHMTDSEVVQTAFKAILTAEEHEVREHFKFDGEAIFGPHFNVNDLVKLKRKGKPDIRKEVE